MIETKTPIRARDTEIIEKEGDQYIIKKELERRERLKNAKKKKA